MKRIIPFLLLALLVAPGFLHAALVSGGAITGPLVDKDSATGRLVLSTRMVDATGAAITPTSGSSSDPSFVNAAGFNFLSWTVKATGVTPNADSVISLTWAATTTSGPVFADLQCAGATGINFIITDSATTPTGFVANSALSGYQPCGQISQVPLEVNAANTPHLHVVAVGLSNTSAAVGIVTKKRP